MVVDGDNQNVAVLTHCDDLMITSDSRIVFEHHARAWRDCRNIDVKLVISAWNTCLNNVLFSTLDYLEEVSLLPDACNQWHMLCSSVARFTFCKSQLIVACQIWSFYIALAEFSWRFMKNMSDVYFAFIFVWVWTCLSVRLLICSCSLVICTTCLIVPYSCWRIVHAMLLSLFVDNTSSHLVLYYLSLPAFTNEYLFLFHIRVWIRTKPM